MQIKVEVLHYKLGKTWLICYKYNTLVLMLDLNYASYLLALKTD